MTVVATLAIVLFLGSALPATSATASSATIVQLWIGNAYMSVNGVQQPIDAQGTKPIIVADRTLVPIRAVIEAFGGSVAWDGSTRKVTVTLQGNSLELWIGNPQASLNGAPRAIDADPSVVPIIINDRTMIPLRFVAESLGIEVQYDPPTRMITLKGSFARWTISTFTLTGNVGSHTSIAVDSNEKIHISHINLTDGKLNYTTNTSGSWITWTVGSASDHATSIAVDANGKSHMVYDGANGDLNYATNATSDAGLTTTVEVSAWSGLFGDQDIALDTNGNPHITYFRGTSFDLRYATKASGVWSTYVVIDGTTSGPLPAYSSSIGLDSSNKAHVSYYDEASDTVKYVTNVSGTWVETTVDTIGMAAGWSTSLAVDSNDKIHISYYDWSNDALKYATNASGSWQTETVDQASGNVFKASLAIDKANGNQVHMVYGSGSGFMYATKSAGTWQITKLDESWTGIYNAIAVGPTAIHVAYKDGSNNTLKYAWKPLP